jgi:hypothetical protein
LRELGSCSLPRTRVSNKQPSRVVCNVTNLNAPNSKPPGSSIQNPMLSGPAGDRMAWARDNPVPASPTETQSRARGAPVIRDTDHASPVCNSVLQLETAQLQWRQLLTGQLSLGASVRDSRPTVLTTQNLRTNVPWGDQMGPKNSDTTRIYAINVNGLSIDRRGGSFDDICRSIREMQVDIFCAQEHHLDTTQSKIRSVLYETATKHWERHRLVIGTSPITFSNVYKPGGTMIVTVDSMMGRVVKQDRDRWGCWVIQEFIGRGNRRLALFSVYQPVD